MSGTQKRILLWNTGWPALTNRTLGLEGETCDVPLGLRACRASHIHELVCRSHPVGVEQHLDGVAAAPARLGDSGPPGPERLRGARPPPGLGLTCLPTE